MSELVSGGGVMVLKILKALKVHALTGLSNGDIAKVLNVRPANANRYLNTLICEGWAINRQ